MPEAVREIVIAGGGLAGWYSAARLCHAMQGRALSVRVVRAAAPGVEADPLDVFCAATLPDQVVAHSELGIDERVFMRECNATFKLATEFHGFDAAARSYLLPHGEIGARLEAVGFHQFVTRLRLAGHELSLDDFSVPSIAARLGRFAHPTRDQRSVLSTYEYAYHLDTHAYTRSLRRLAEKLGAIAVDEDLAQVVTDADGQGVRALVLGDGTQVTADLFIDCTGARAALLAGALRVPFESWRSWLPCDAALLTRLQASEPRPQTRAVAQPQGWRWQVPLRGAVEQAAIHVGHAREAETPGTAGDAGAAAARRVGFENGRYRDAWRGNCIAIGPAAGFLEPLASTGLKLIDSGVARLVALFPDRGDLALMAAEYNRGFRAEYDGARDFVLLHYLLGRRRDGLAPGASGESPPPSVAHRLEMFRHRGRVVLHDDEIFEEADWACTFMGLGVRPTHHAILAAQMSEADLLAQCAKIARLMRSAAERMPPHLAYLQSYLA